MKRGLAPAGVVFMGFAVALALLGIGYGLYSDTLRVSGAVATGSVDASFKLNELDEGLTRGTAGGPTDNGVNEDKEQGGIDVANCGVRIANSALGLDSAAADPAPVDASDDLISAKPTDFMYVALKNAYPGYNCYADFSVLNSGAIPMMVNQPVVGPQPAAGVLTVEFAKCYDNGVQVEPGKEAECTLHVQVGRAARANSSYRFGATICAYQWNATNAVACAIPVEIEPVPADLIDTQPLPVTNTSLTPVARN
jgi:hypothetical protein